MIGRGSETDVRLDAPGISVAHACIRAELDGYWIQDVGSLNGTFVNGQRIGWELQPLQNFDRIQVRGQECSGDWEFLQPPDSSEF